MRSSSLRSTAAPSSQLLKFLRAQNNEVAYFTPSCVARLQSIHLEYRKHKFISRPASSARAYATCSTALRLADNSCSTHYSRRIRDWNPKYSRIPLESSISFLNQLWPRRKPAREPPYHQYFENDPLQYHEIRARVTPHIHDPTIFASRLPRCTQSHTQSTRSFSTSNTLQNDHRFLRRFWPRGRDPRNASLQPDDLPPISGIMEDGASLGRLLRSANELRLRCTEFDENGNVTVNNGEFKKSELIAKYGLLPRDLRKIDSSLLPNILVRPSAILVNLLNLRVLIKANRVLVFDAFGSTNSYSQSLFMYDLENKLRSPSLTSPATPLAHALPYEFRALEAVLISVTSGLESEFDGVREPVVRVLRELEEDIDRDKLRHLLIYSKKLGTFEQKARLVRDAIDDLLEAEDDLTDLYLTEKSLGIERAEDDHTEVEMLLESYHKVCDEIVQAAGNLVSNIRNTEEIVKAILDANRNSLMLLDLKFSIGTLGLGAGTFGAALYGMNLKNFIEESDLGFWAVSAWCSIFTLVVCIYGLRKLRRVQRISMWGAERGEEVRGKTGWASLGGVAGERPMELEPLIGPAPGGEHKRRLKHGAAATSNSAAAAAGAAKAVSRQASQSQSHWGYGHARDGGAAAHGLDSSHGSAAAAAADAWHGNSSGSFSFADSSTVATNERPEMRAGKSWREVMSYAKNGGASTGVGAEQQEQSRRNLQKQRGAKDWDHDQYRDFGNRERDQDHSQPSQHDGDSIPELGDPRADGERNRDGFGVGMGQRVKGAFRGV